MTTPSSASSPRYTLITGPRRSGKTHKALELARADGRPFGVIFGCEPPGAHQPREYEGAALVAAASDIGPLRAAQVDLIVIDDAHKIHSSRWDGILFLQADFIIIASAPSRADASPWLQVVKEAKRIDLDCAMMSRRPIWFECSTSSNSTAQTPQHKHDCKGCVCLGHHGGARSVL